jgi:hypothetical protein
MSGGGVTVLLQLCAAYVCQYRCIAAAYSTLSVVAYSQIFANSQLLGFVTHHKEQPVSILLL